MNSLRDSVNIRVVNILLCICFLTICFSGCASLRQKFTRKKKDKTGEQAFVPVLDPIDYPASSTSFAQKYKYHYSLLKVWQRDLSKNIESGESDKNQKYLIGRIVFQLEEMKKLVVETKKNELEMSINEWNSMLAVYDSPAPMRSSASLKRKVEEMAKEARNKFNPKDIDKFLANP